MDEAFDTVRNLYTALRPVELDMGIVPALEWVVNRFETFANVECSLSIAPPELDLDESRALVLFRIVQESLTNIAKHAQATKVEVMLNGEADACVLKVRDNGKGFVTSAKKANSFGLVGIRERVLVLGGTVSIESRSGAGTEIVVRIPRGEER